MRTLSKIFLVLLLLFLVSIFALNWIGDRYLGRLAQVALPAAEESLGVSLALEDLGFNLFRGTVRVAGLKVGNPEGFATETLYSLDRGFINVGLMRLLRSQEIHLQEITVLNSDLTIVRNTAGEVNLRKLMERFEAEDIEDPEEEEDPREPAELPPFALDRFEWISLVRYVGERDGRDSFEIGFQVAIDATDIASVGAPTDRGFFSVRGNLAGSQELFVMDMKGEVAPISDPLRLTMEMSGKVDSMDISMFEAFQRDFGLREGMMGLDLVLKVDEGVFDESQSVVNVLIAQPAFGSGVNVPAGFAPATLRFPVRIGGTLEEPRIYFREGLMRGIREAVSGTAIGGALQERLQKEGETLREGAGDRVRGLLDRGGAANESAEDDAEDEASQGEDASATESLNPESAVRGLLGR